MRDMSKATIFDIQRLSLHDGPGARTTVFFKGCGLRCAWCHNPESQHMEPEILFDATKCIGCGACVGLCAARTAGPTQFDRTKCFACGKCAQRCPTGALQLAGQRLEAAEIAHIALRDRQLFHISGGGVTLSGGEPLLQVEAAAELLHILRAEGVHTAVDTAGDVPWECFDAVLEDTDLFLYDIKAMDAALHRRVTGVDNARILQNLPRLLRVRPVVVRVPLVAKLNLGQVKAIAQYLSSLTGELRVELLKYHALGKGKYVRLGRQFVEYAPPTDAQMRVAAAEFERRGVEVAF